MLLDKENSPADAQPGKLQRATAGTGSQPLVDASPPVAAGEPTEFAMRGDDDAVLNEKMKGKGKLDYKSVQNEVERVRMKLQREDAISAQVDAMLAADGTYKEKGVTGPVAIQLDSQAKKLSALQKTYLSQRNKLETTLIKLQATNEELAAVNEKIAAADEKIAAADEKIADIKKKLADANENLKAWQIMETILWGAWQIMAMILWGERPDDSQDTDDDPAY